MSGMIEQVPSPGNPLRLAALRELNILDTETEKVYDDISKLTADLCETPICLVSLVEEDRQWFKSEVGLGIYETPIEQSICAHAITQNDYLEISDTHLDSRTQNNSLCQGDKPIRFYAGAILRTLEGWPLGTLCVLDYKPRQMTDIQRRILDVHAKSVTRQLELTRALIQKIGTHAESESAQSLSEDERRLREATRRRFDKLTPREKEVLALIAGHSSSLNSKQIARELNISFRTVHHHRASIMLKMKVDSVAELIAVSLKARIFY